MNSDKTGFEHTSTVNRALHSIAAHLHRFRSELSSTEGIILELNTQYAAILEGDDADKAARGFNQVLSQMQATSRFVKELEKKIQNILALVRTLQLLSRTWELIYAFIAVQPNPN